MRRRKTRRRKRRRRKKRTRTRRKRRMIHVMECACASDACAGSLLRRRKLLSRYYKNTPRAKFAELNRFIHSLYLPGCIMRRLLFSRNFEVTRSLSLPSPVNCYMYLHLYGIIIGKLRVKPVLTCSLVENTIKCWKCCG